MRIAVMLRTLEESQGIGIYARNLMSSILSIDRENLYYFIYASKKQVGSFGQRNNLRENVLTYRSKLYWDQWQVPRFAEKKVDIIFNTKFSVPLFTKCKTIMVFHGSEHYVYPEFYSKLDILYNRIFMPLFCRKASAMSSVSKVTADDMAKFIRFDRKKAFVIHSAIDPCFKPVADESVLLDIRNKYKLPERFILFVGKLYPGKNFKNIVKAYKLIKQEIDLPLKLVSVGDLRWKYEKDLKEIDDHKLKNDIQLTGWIEQEDLPAIYMLADLFLFPSFYEGFGIPLVEAMACGCPVVTSTTGACPEISGSAAMYVNPNDPRNIADGMKKVINDRAFRQTMIKQGYLESNRFSWQKAAKETLHIFKTVMNNEI